MKEIKLDEMNLLLKNKVIKNTKNGFVNSDGIQVGFYKTCHNKRFLEDRYVDIAKKLFDEVLYGEKKIKK